MLINLDISEETKDIKLLPIEGRWTPEFDVKTLKALVKSVPGNILEIGCHTGITTKELADASPDSIIYAIDYTGSELTMAPEQHYEVPKEFGKYVLDNPKIKLFNMKSKDFQYTKDMDITFIFIDGDHSYEGVKTDTENALAYLKNTKKPAMIVWHDYNATHPEWVKVKQYVDELSEHYDINVYTNTWIASLLIKPIKRNARKSK